MKGEVDAWEFSVGVGTLYKALSAEGTSCNGGNGKWNLPTQNKDGTWKPGRWMPKVENIIPCKRGYHLFERKDILSWLNATLYEAEGRGECIDHGDKVVYSQARLLRPVLVSERALRLFACRVAEGVLPLFEKDCPNDDRPRKAIETARRYADGEATEEELDAARDAAWAAAWDAAWAAARDAAWAAARAAAWDAARAKYTTWLWEMIDNEG